MRVMISRSQNDRKLQKRYYRIKEDNESMTNQIFRIKNVLRSRTVHYRDLSRILVKKATANLKLLSKEISVRNLQTELAERRQQQKNMIITLELLKLKIHHISQKQKSKQQTTKIFSQGSQYIIITIVQIVVVILSLFLIL